MHWGDLIKEKIDRYGPLVLGVDPVLDHAPSVLSDQREIFLERYTTALLDGAEDKVGIVKFQSAFFEAFGSVGVAQLAKCVAIARERGMAIILDAKRGDISSTASAYAQAYLTPGTSDLEVDCMTINPFLGPDTLEPFVNCARRYGKGLFVLVKTSNSGSGWLQDQEISGATVSHRLADLVAGWAEETKGNSGIGAVGAVVGATFPEQAVALRRAMPRSVFLAPGLGAQGGDPHALAQLATETAPVVISASRGIAAVDDRAISLREYVRVVSERIMAFNNQIHPAFA